MLRKLFAAMAVAFVVLFAFSGRAWALEPKIYPNMSICGEPHKVIVDQKGTCLVEELSGKNRIFVREDRAKEVREFFKSQKVRKQIVICPEPKDVKITPQAPRKSSKPKKSAVPVKPTKPAKVKREASQSGQQYCPPAKPVTPTAPPKAMGYDEGQQIRPPAKSDAFDRQRIQVKASPGAAPPAGFPKPALSEGQKTRAKEAVKAGNISKPVLVENTEKTFPDPKGDGEWTESRRRYVWQETDIDGAPVQRERVVDKKAWTNLAPKGELQKSFAWIPGQQSDLPGLVQVVGSRMISIDPATGYDLEMPIRMGAATYRDGRGNAAGTIGKYASVPEGARLLTKIPESQKERTS